MSYRPSLYKVTVGDGPVAMVTRVDQPSRRHKGNIYLDVDEVPAVLDGVDVGVVDGLLVVFDASGPIRGRAKDLRGSGRRQTGSPISLIIDVTISLIK